MMRNEYYQKYEKQKGSVRNRVDKNGDKIDFKLSFEQWMDIWQSSGKLNERGSKKGQYCMSRYNDIGHYEVGNVFIQRIEDNISQAHKGKIGPLKGEQRSKEFGEKIRQTKIGKSRPRSVIDALIIANSKSVKTPDGIFSSLKEAGKFYNLTPEAIGYRIKTKEGYSYMGDQK